MYFLAGVVELVVRGCSNPEPSVPGPPLDQGREHGDAGTEYWSSGLEGEVLGDLDDEPVDGLEEGVIVALPLVKCHGAGVATYGFKRGVKEK